MSCLFDSMRILLGLELSSTQIRQQICDYLEAGGLLIEGLDTIDLLKTENPSYVEHMRSESTMGGAIELQAACSIWNLRIVVKTTQSEIEFLPVQTKPDQPLRSICMRWHQAHYEPIVEKIEKIFFCQEQSEINKSDPNGNDNLSNRESASPS